MVMMGELHIKSEREAKAFIRGLAKERKRKEADAEIGEGAGKRLERMEKRIVELEQEVKVLRAQTADVWAWWKRTQEGK